MSTQAIDPGTIEVLQGASSLRLYQRQAIVEGLLAAPRRGLVARMRRDLPVPIAVSVHQD